MICLIMLVNITVAHVISVSALALGLLHEMCLGCYTALKIHTVFLCLVTIAMLVTAIVTS